MGARPVKIAAPTTRAARIATNTIASLVAANAWRTVEAAVDIAFTATS
jgi:hypothetical protein